MIVGNKIIVLEPSEFTSLVPVYYKDRYWLTSFDENEQEIFTQITWKELSENDAYRRLNGKTPIVKGDYHLSIEITEMDEIALINDGYNEFLKIE